MLDQQILPSAGGTNSQASKSRTTPPIGHHSPFDGEPITLELKKNKQISKANQATITNKKKEINEQNKDMNPSSKTYGKQKAQV